MLHCPAALLSTFVLPTTNRNANWTSCPTPRAAYQKAGLQVPRSCSRVEDWSLASTPEHERDTNEKGTILVATHIGVASADPTGVTAVRHVTYYLLLGADRVAMVDLFSGTNLGCTGENRESAAYAAYDRALAPFVKAGKVLQVKEARCFGNGTWTKYSSERHEAYRRIGLALEGLVSSLSARDLVLVLDEDERLVITSPAHTLRHVLDYIRAAGICSLFLPWRVFGSSGHECPPVDDLGVAYTRRLRTYLETSAVERAATHREAKGINMGDPYYSGDISKQAQMGKVIGLARLVPASGSWSGHGSVGRLGPNASGCLPPAIHMCAHPHLVQNTPACEALVSDGWRQERTAAAAPGAPRHHSHVAPDGAATDGTGSLPATAAPRKPPFSLRLHHYAFKSRWEWEQKKRVWSARQARLFGNDPCPSRYNAIQDETLSRQLPSRIGLVPDVHARHCLESVLLPHRQVRPK
jgi:hypothetical protein